MAFIAATAAAGALGVGGAMIGASATKDAAEMQANAARYAADLQNQQYQQQRADQEPWRQAGSQALGQMGDSYFQHNFDSNDFQKDPGYQFRMDQGQKALEASAAARGGLMTGNFATELSRYGQDYASGEYQNAYNRFTNNQSNRFNRLASLAGIGQTANGQLGRAGSNMANMSGEAAMGGANAAAAGRIGQANAMSGALSGIGNNWMQMQMINRAYPQKAPNVDPGGST